MALSITEEIKAEILKTLRAEPATWGKVTAEVSREFGVSPSYVERAFGELVRNGVVRKQSNWQGFPQYALSASPGAIEGKYRPIGERRMELEGQHTYPNGKSGPYDYQPWDDDIKGPSAV
jgi:DNA-binding transcriptional ArsR family regulator